MQTLIEMLKAAIMAESYEDRAGRSVISVKSALEAIDRVAAEQPEGSDWILCEENTPKESGYYLATRQEISRVRVCYFSGVEWYADETALYPMCVIAWRLLPEAYQPEQEEQHEDN